MSAETKLRLYLAADHRSYADVHEIAREHEGMVRCVLGRKSNAKPCRHLFYRFPGISIADDKRFYFSIGMF